MSFHDRLIEVGVNRLIELRARTLFFPWPSFLTISEPTQARTSPLPAGAPNHLPNSLNGNKLARSPNDRPTIERTEKKMKKSWRDVDLNPGPLPLPLDPTDALDRSTILAPLKALLVIFKS